jgi:eukaryotic-like serine/threonine-protein kinase
MNNPSQDPFGSNPFGGDPFGGTSFGQAAPGGPPVFNAPPTPSSPTGGEANTLATLSVIFAFVFAPAGAVLGHLGLSQIARTGQPGRRRALTGIVLSYSVIVIAVVALVLWQVLGSGDKPAAPTASAPAAPVAPSAAPPPPTTTTPPAPTVAPTDLAGILPGLDQLKTLTDNTSLTAGATYTAPTALNKGGVSRPECASTMTVGDPSAYTASAPSGFLITRYEAHEFHGMDAVADEDQSAAAYPNSAAAQAAANSILTTWRACSGSTMTQSNGNASTPVTVGALADAGNGITTLTVRGGTAKMPMLFHRAIVAKANIVADVWVMSLTTDRTAVAVAIANAILAKIPG